MVRPELCVSGQDAQLLSSAHEKALDNLLDINSIACDLDVYNKTGLLRAGARIIRAGGDYQQPWTRDASINSWNAASVLCPQVARDTLWAVCERDERGKLVIQRDNQWWDKVIWVIGAWHHYCATGDRAFLHDAMECAESSLCEMAASRFDAEFGLFQGPAMIQDGISGYPSPPANAIDALEDSGFVLDYPLAHRVMALSTNCIYVGAYRSAGLMADAMGKPSAQWHERSQRLGEAINRHLWHAQTGTYAYFLHGAGELRGQPVLCQEANGLAMSVLMGVAGPARARAILAQAHRMRHGIPLVAPHFARFSEERPGRHNRIVWPEAQGFWGHACAKVGLELAFRDEVLALAGLARSSDWNFMEIYNGDTGRAEGGWQSGYATESRSHQTWSATAFLRMVYLGLFGLEFAPLGLELKPTLPRSWGPARLGKLRYRNMTLNIELLGTGRMVRSVHLDGVLQTMAFISANLDGEHDVGVMLSDA